MKLENLTIALRPRLPWEAVDLGCTLVRRDYGRLLTLWAITIVPIWAILAAFLWEYPLWYALVVWWLKPLYDRVPLFFLSRAAFGSKPTVKETLREWPRLWSRFLFSALLLRRLSMIRSFALPVWMLEGQRGKAVSKRVTALATDGGSSGASLTWVFVKLEIAATFGIMALVSSIGPSSGLPDWGELFQNPEGYSAPLAQQWAGNIIYLLAMTLIEPFYVGAGFGLYLNSRTKIEGWDVELIFRRLAARLRPVVAALLAIGLFIPGLTHSQEPSKGPQPNAEEQAPGVKEALKEILDQPEFKEHSRTQKVWVPDGKAKADSSLLEGFGYFLAWLFYLIAGAIVGFALYLLGRWIINNQSFFRRPKAGARSPTPEGPRIVMGLDIARESLPEDIVSAARSAWAAGHFREALSLLYRGSLSRLVEQRNLPIRDSDTEDDCVIQVSRLGDAGISDFFRQLTRIWVRAAYAGQEAQEHEFTQLCQAWPFSHTPVGGQRQRVFASTALMLFLLPSLTACSGKWEDLTIPLGYKGEARLNPFLAAQQLLAKYGHDSERLLHFKNLPYAEEGVLILSGESGMPEARADQLLQWTEDGGHLIYALAGCAPYNDWGMFSSLSTYGYAGNEDRADPILDKLGVSVENNSPFKDLGDALKLKKKKDEGEKEKENEKAKEAEDDETVLDTDSIKAKIEEPEDVPLSRSVIDIRGEDYNVDFPDMLELSLDRELRRGEYVAGALDNASALSLRYGRGRITFITHARPLRNRYLDENDHAAWLLAMVGDEYRHVAFLVTIQQSFWELLWNRAWMPLVGLALLTLIWLWKNMPRFGPLRRVELHETKHFVDHISALGQFFLRLNRTEILLNAAADAVRTRAIRLFPQLVYQNDEALIRILKDRSELSEERIRTAFDTTSKAASHEMVRRLQDLQDLRAALK